ncbi:MAG: hypothetical protein DRP45_11780, partial [Candidatus Zixiibacteriota bacterium]
MTGSKKVWLGLILLASMIGLYYGWKLFWFLTDDALIAFRYVSNSILGLGYVWNPPPFRPVEGYTSFLWVALLDIVWRVTGAEPSQSANHLSLFFSFMTLLLATLTVMRMNLTRQLSKYRLLFLALVLFGILTNRTFLAWTSSGLETAMFNFWLFLWMANAVLARKRGGLWLFGLTSSASLVYLSRPDGLLILLSTVLIVAVSFRSRLKAGQSPWKWLPAIAPLLIPVLHLAWRLSFYGEWLPNTYYAKYVAAWPEAGTRYLASFILEYGLWVWGLALLWFLFVWLRGKTSNCDVTDKSDVAPHGNVNTDNRPDLSRSFHLAVVVATIIVHIGYYTFVIGGDHFEYRVFSYLIPLIFISFLWLQNRSDSDPIITACTLGLFILLSWPVQWTHWDLTRNLTERNKTWIMRVPIESEFPSGLKWYARSFDDLQSWLIEHHVCMRHQEHKVFYQYLSARYPERSLEKLPRAGEFPTMACQSAGVPGWVFPRVAILDAWGLNDYVIARHKARPKSERLMAHDRLAPFGYLESFALNHGLFSPMSFGIKQREVELTAKEIIETEKFWTDR